MTNYLHTYYFFFLSHHVQSPSPASASYPTSSPPWSSPVVPANSHDRADRRLQAAFRPIQLRFPRRIQALIPTSDSSFITDRSISSQHLRHRPTTSRQISIPDDEANSSSDHHNSSPTTTTNHTTTLKIQSIRTYNSCKISWNKKFKKQR